MTIREEIFKLVYTEDINNPNLVWHTYQDERIEKIIKLFEKLIDEKQHIKNLKPATTPEDVIYNCGIVDGLQKLKEELSE